MVGVVAPYHALHEVVLRQGPRLEAIVAQPGAVHQTDDMPGVGDGVAGKDVNIASQFFAGDNVPLTKRQLRSGGVVFEEPVAFGILICTKQVAGPVDFDVFPALLVQASVEVADHVFYRLIIGGV